MNEEIRRQRIPREPEPDLPTIAKSDGTLWHYSEIRKALGKKFLELQGNEGYCMSCVEDPKHVQGTYIYWHTNQDGSSGFKYECRLCRVDFGLSPDEQFANFAAWLKEREPQQPLTPLFTTSRALLFQALQQLGVSRPSYIMACAKSCASPLTFNTALSPANSRTAYINDLRGYNSSQKLWDVLYGHQLRAPHALIYPGALFSYCPRLLLPRPFHPNLPATFSHGSQRGKPYDCKLQFSGR
jgi:hypothetical protein